jgi:hypothetical protein
MLKNELIDSPHYAKFTSLLTLIASYARETPEPRKIVLARPSSDCKL